MKGLNQKPDARRLRSRQSYTTHKVAVALGVHTIIIEPTTVKGDRGQRYRVHFEGAVLIEATWCPEFDACRLLSARGVMGPLEVWRSKQPYACMRLDIQKAALLTVADAPSAGPRFVTWVPVPEQGVAGAVSRREESSGNGKAALRGSEHLPSKKPASWVG
jgi:hypothetical protein